MRREETASTRGFLNTARLYSVSWLASSFVMSRSKEPKPET